MERTISFMVGKGSQNHNSRTFIADNVDASRTTYNIEYCNLNLKQVYHEMFDEALQKYNNKQTRSDRKIQDYYEKIRLSKQEKLFYEAIVQVGNREDMNAQSDQADLAAQILDEYIREFSSRNVQLKVFSAHLHMDEETPHLHIDFVPFITGSKQGLETRVSLKKALMKQGFKGGSRKETELKQWVDSEKEQLAKVMERYGIGWEQKGTTNKHLSLLEFEKEQRYKEVCALEAEIAEKSEVFSSLAEKEKALLPVVEKAERIQGKLKILEEAQQYVDENLPQFDSDPEWQMPEPAAMMTAKSYKEKKVIPFFEKLKFLLKQVINKYLQLKENYHELNKNYWKVWDQNTKLSNQLDNSEQENAKLKGVAKDYGIVCKAIGEEKVDTILLTEKQNELAAKQRNSSKRQYER